MIQHALTHGYLEMLSPVEIDVLRDLLLNGDNLPANIADNTGRHQKSVQRRMSDLEENELVRNKGRGVYALTDKGLKTAQSIVSD
jgi:predicted transcriptional regulator